MQLTRQEIIEKLKDILLAANDNNFSAIDGCDENSRLIEDFGLSSVGVLYIVIAVEEEFGIRFENVGMADFETLGNVVDYIEERLK